MLIEFLSPQADDLTTNASIALSSEWVEEADPSAVTWVEVENYAT